MPYWIVRWAAQSADPLADDDVSCYYLQIRLDSSPQTAVPPFAAPAHWLCLQGFPFSVLAEAIINVSKA
jgi:hypothetical protein